MTVTLPRIYPITDTSIAGVSHLEQVEQMIDGGATLIQLRDKKASPQELYLAAKDAIDFAHTRGCRILINDRVDIAIATSADGVHLGQDDLPPDHARRLLGPNAIIGFSTHSISQAVEAIRTPIDYIAIGPVFETRTKENPDEVIGLDGVRAVRREIGSFPLVAIGGITSSTVSDLLKAGADSVAIISDLLNDPSEITARTSELLSTAER